MESSGKQQATGGLLKRNNVSKEAKFAMKLLSTLKRVSHRTLAVGVLSAAFVGAGLFAVGHSGAISGGDCDDNAVIRCGVGSVSGVKSKYAGDKTVRQIFSCMGISSNDVDNMHQGLNSNKTGVVDGTVTKAGKVIVNGQVVATAAETGGRTSMPGSTNRTSACGTPFFERPPSVSFKEDSLAALVDLQNGQFQFAILNSCGNPIVATPVAQPKPTPKPQPKPAPKPNYTLTKQVAIKGSSNFVKSLSNLQPGTHVIYHVTVNSTGNAPVTNLKVSDTPQAHIQYVPGTLKRDGVDVSNKAGSFFGSGYLVSSLPAGSSTVFSFEAVVAANETGSTCQAETLDNTGHTTATNLPPASSKATVSTVCAKTPVCTNFTVQASQDRTVKVTNFTYQPNGASFVKAVISWDVTGDTTITTPVNNANQVVGQTHQYSADKTYLIAVNATFKQSNGKTVVVGGPQCEQEVTFTPSAPPTVTTPTPPSQLSNTGAGSVVGLFAAVTAIGALAHRIFLVRRLNS